MTDLPHGEWSPLLVGHQWPGQVALAALAASAGRREVTATAHAGYADTLRSIRTDLLVSQEGIAAEATHRAFHAGESTAQDIASRNAAKRDAYRAAHAQVAELRSALSEIAEAGNAEIARIRQSELPLTAKISAIVDAVVTGQAQANARAAACGAGVFDAIQRVLTSTDSDVSAREFTGGHGVEWHSAFRSPHPDRFRHHVERALDPSAPGAGSDGVSGTGAPAHSAAPAPPQTGPDADADPAPDRPRVSAPAVPAAIRLPPHDTAPRPPADPAPPVASAAPVVPAAEVAPAAAVAPIVAARPMAAPVVTGVVTATAPPAGGLPSYGADRRPSTAAPPLAPWAPPPSAAPVSAPAGAANPAGLMGGSAVVRRNTVLSPRPASPVGIVENATAAASLEAAGNPLRRLLDAVARQQPGLRWTIGGTPDGRILLVAGLGGGWVPPGIAIPSGVSLPEPGAPRSEHSDLIGALSHAPGQHVPSHDDARTLPVSTDARDVEPVLDLGWRVSRATRWRDGLPRLAHTIVRAAITGTGLLESEMDLLGEELRTAEVRVLAGYPDVVDPAELGNWQLLAAINALAAGETALAHYHFAWFETAS